MPSKLLDRYIQYPTTIDSSQIDFLHLKRKDGILLFDENQKITHILLSSQIAKSAMKAKIPILEMGPLPLVTVKANASISDVQKQMVSKNLHCVLVRGENGKSGIVFALDILVYLAGQDQSQTEKLLKEQEEYFTFVIHDIKEPLTVLSYAVQKMEKSRTLDADNRGMLAKVSSHTNRLLAMAEDILLMTKAKFPKNHLPFTRHNIRKFVSDLTPTFRDVCAVRNINFATSDIVDGQVLMNHQALSRCLANIVENAVKYGNPGDTIRLTTRFEGRENDSWLRIVISDQGIGIPENQLEDIFASFYQVNTGSSVSGVGLGLTIASKFAEAHGGRVEVTNNEGASGSTFMLVLPHAIPAAKATTPLASNQTYSVLVVDDDPEILHYLAKELTSLGHSIMTAGNGVVALQCFKKFKPDIVITDVKMPGMDGMALLAEIRQTDKEVPVFLFSGKFSRKDGERIAQESSAAGFLPKPLERRQLADIFTAGNNWKR